MALFRRVPAHEADVIRSRLPPVPGEFSGTIEADDIDPEALTRPGWPRPRYRRIPIPATSYAQPGELNIIRSDDDAWRATLLERRCDLCAEPLDEPHLWLFGETIEDEPDWLLVRGCMHRRCWVSTAHWCVHIRERLLDSTMCAGALAAELSTDPAFMQILDKTSSSVTAEANIIAEYRIARDAVIPAWPYRPVEPTERAPA